MKDEKPNIDSTVTSDGFVPAEGLDAAIESRISSDKTEKTAKDEKRESSKRSRQKTEKPIPEAEVQAEEVPEPEKEKGDGEKATPVVTDVIPDAISDSQIERAVKAGLSISDARAFKDAKALERITGILEKRSEPEKPVAEKSTVATEDLLKQISDIPDEFDPEMYDENFIKLAKTFKTVVGALQAQVASLKEAGLAKAEQSWFDSQVSGLGKGVVDTLDANKKANLETKFKVLEAGYKAAGQTMKREDVFAEATKLVLGDVVSVENDAAKKVADRSSQHISRPAGNRVIAKGDPKEEVADDVRRYLEKKA